MDADHDDLKASLESVDWWLSRHVAGACRIRTVKGYVTKNGGFSEYARKAQVFSGPGVAIQYARALGFAILSW